MKNKKTSINVFYGPRKEFENLIKGKKNKEFFTAIVQEYDDETKAIHHVVEGQPVEQKKHIKRKIANLIINSDEYSTITEGAIQNFNSIIDYYDISNIYLQNPPYIIAEKIKKVYSKYVENRYQYKSINLDVIKQINNKYSSNIIGQDLAKKSLLRNILSFDKFKSLKKPIVLMFYGPSGVGKTETARFISTILDEKLFYKQFSMFQNNEFANYLFGGQHSQNSFAKELLDRESNVILLDEFDKANNVFYSAFYQFFDEGIYNDKNYSVSLDNGIIICTSNYNSKEEIRAHLGDPIYFRFDGFIPFSDLDNESLIKIIDIYYSKYYSELSVEDKEIIDSYTNKSGKTLIQSLHESSKGLINARNINTIVKDCILQILLEDVLKHW